MIEVGKLIISSSPTCPLPRAVSRFKFYIQHSRARLVLSIFSSSGLRVVELARVIVRALVGTFKILVYCRVLMLFRSKSRLESRLESRTITLAYSITLYVIARHDDPIIR